MRPASNKYPKFNYELFKHSNFSFPYWSWNYRGCWHQTCPPIVPYLCFYILLIPIIEPFNWFYMDISCHYLIELRLGNLRACCLPWKWSPFLRRPLQNQTLILCTRYNHGRHIMYRLKLISQTLERYVVDTKVIRSTQSYLESPTNSSD